MMGWLPENVSTYGARIDNLFFLIYYLTAAVCVLVLATMVVFLIRFRSREGRRAEYSHGSTVLEVIWTVVPALILATLTILSGIVWREVRGPFPPGDVWVRVIGKQFNWRVIYPGPDGRFATEDDLELENDLHVPVGKVVRVLLGSDDVIHSFFLPHLRLKQDAVPGREIQVWFEATRAGEYEIACAELCGFGHYQMRGTLTVHSGEGYEDWVRRHWPDGGAVGTGGVPGQR